MVTVMTSLALAEMLPSLSVTVKAMLTVPLKFSAGLNTSVAACAAVIGVPATTGVTPSARYSTPCAALGKLVMVTLVTVPSVSVPLKATAIGVSSAPLEVLGVATGGSCTLVTVIATASVSLSGVPALSVDLTVRVSAPL